MKIMARLLILFLVAWNQSIIAETDCNPIEARPAHFGTVYDKAIDVGQELCLGLAETISTEMVAQNYKEFADVLAKEVNAQFKGKTFHSELMQQIVWFKTHAYKGVFKHTLPYFVVQQPFTSNNMEVKFDTFDTAINIDFDSAECTLAPTCEDLFEALTIAINEYKEPYFKASTKDFSGRTGINYAHWERYLEESRPQTMLDTVFTTWIEQKHYRVDKHVGAIERQWFLAHPSIVFDYASAAPDGDQLNGALAVEWVGINWWDKESSPINYPFGISFVSVYSDMPEVDDLGIGVMFNFNNSISIGWADHDGDSSVFVTVDFLNLFTEKKKQWKDYKEVIRKGLE